MAGASRSRPNPDVGVLYRGDSQHGGGRGSHDDARMARRVDGGVPGARRHRPKAASIAGESQVDVGRVGISRRRIDASRCCRSPSCGPRRVGLLRIRVGEHPRGNPTCSLIAVHLVRSSCSWTMTRMRTPLRGCSVTSAWNRPRHRAHTTDTRDRILLGEQRPGGAGRMVGTHRSPRARKSFSSSTTMTASLNGFAASMVIHMSALHRQLVCGRMSNRIW